MKKITILLFTLFLGYHAHSQILITLLLGDKLNSDELEFGLEGGLNYTSLNGNGLETNKYLGNLNLGFYFDIKLKGQWNIYTGCLVKANMGVARLTDNDLNKLGATIHDFEVDGIPVEGNYSQEMRYFLVPIFIKYRFKN
ncbi:MAG: outer membrane beta-barrel protein, partial [Schleiferiaceae bacterium]|nr:outer membrane beta-barrel protein [Schleiferiaceae bacterium]